MGLGGERGLSIPGEHAAAALPKSPQAEHPSRAVHIFIYQLHQRFFQVRNFLSGCLPALLSLFIVKN